MEREIKFRGKRIDNGEWVYGHYSDFNFNPDGLAKMRYYITVPIGGREYEVVAETVCQYIGLKDRNGKEIYESDILRRINTPLSYWNGVVKYIPASFRILPNAVEYVLNELLASTTEVVGNIHDNPRLIKTE